MPLPDIPANDQRAGRRPFRDRWYMAPFHEAMRRRNKRRRDLDDGGVPVEPINPRNLEGGAAAALEFDD